MKKVKKMRFISVIASIGLMMFFACTQRKNLVPNTISDGEHTLTVLYDDDFRIQELLSETYKYSFFYNGKGNLIKITGLYSNLNEEFEYYFSYSGDTVTVKHLRSASGFEADNVYIIDEKGYAKKVSTQNNYDIRSEEVFLYDQDGNLLNINRKEQLGMFFPAVSSMISFEYDNAHGIFKNINAPKWLYLFIDKQISDYNGFFLSMQNNVIKKTIHGNYPISHNCIYTYKNNYPETMIITGTFERFQYITYINKK